MMLQELFSKQGYEVLTLNEPMVCPLYEKQTKQCDMEYPCADIVITDFEMPKMNERGCMVNIKNKAVISGNLDEGNRSKIEALGSAFFPKPLNFDELTDWLNVCDKRIDLSQPLGDLE
jgi:DNA-binding response OmpR family regulator